MVHKLQISDLSVGNSRLKSIASQITASISFYILLLDLGMTISFTTIAIPDLLNAKEGLSLDESQASWFGSLMFLTQPIGALLSGPVVDYFGRKKASFIVNIPHLVGWTLMYFAWDLPSLFIADALLGLGTGIMEAPLSAYVGEISEASIRGSLCTSLQVFASVGIFLMYFLGMLVNWRYAALICVVAPLTSMCLVVLVPETPVWLVVNGREKDAMKSLCRLRGWTTPDKVKEEFDELREYGWQLQRCVICAGTDKTVEPTKCEHEDINYVKKFILKFKYVMLCKETLRPMSLVIMYFLFYVMSGLTPIRPNMINVCGAFGMAQDGKHIALMVGVITFFAGLGVIVLVKLLGKRKLAISSMFLSGLSCSLLAVYAGNYLDGSVFSYDINTFPKQTSSVPLVFFYLMTIFNGLGIPWVLLGEVFPFRSRATAQGMSAAANYAFTFLASKSFIDLELGIKLWGTFATYAGFCFAGTVYLYFFLPETENKTLQQIEELYSGELRIFADDPFINFFKKKR